MSKGKQERGADVHGRNFKRPGARHDHGARPKEATESHQKEGGGRGGRGGRGGKRVYDARGDHKHNPKDNDKGRKGKAHITDEVLATASEGDCSDDPSDDHQSYLTLSTATPLLLHTETPSTSVRFLLDSGASNNITNNVTLARSFNFKKLRRPGKTFGGSVAGHQMTATLSGTLDWAPGTTYYVPDSTANLLALGEYQVARWVRIHFCPA